MLRCLLLLTAVLPLLFAQEPPPYRGVCYQQWMASLSHPFRVRPFPPSLN